MRGPVFLCANSTYIIYHRISEIFDLQVVSGVIRIIYPLASLFNFFLNFPDIREIHCTSFSTKVVDRQNNIAPIRAKLAEQKQYINKYINNITIYKGDNDSILDINNLHTLSDTHERKIYKNIKNCF